MADMARQFALEWRRICRSVMAEGVASVRKAASLLGLLLLLLFATGSASIAQQGDGSSGSPNGELEIVTTKEEGFARIILNFVGRNLLPGYSIKQENSIFVIRFDEAVNSTPVTTLPSILPDYVTVARLDPDGKGIRIALKSDVRINTMEAGERLYIDILPTSWQGLPPPLPPEVVRELAKRAEEALRLAKSLEQANQGSRVRPKLDLRIGDHPTFTRVAFIWNIPFDSTFERQGQEVRVLFNHKTDVDLSKLRAELPPLISDISVSYEGVGTQFKILVAPTSDVRAFREDDSYVVDITGDKQLFQTKGAEESITRAVSTAGDTGVLVANGVGGEETSGNDGLAGNNRIGSASEWASDANAGVSDIILGPGPNGEDQSNALFANSQVTEPIDPNAPAAGADGADPNLQNAALSNGADNRYLAIPPTAASEQAGNAPSTQNGTAVATSQPAVAEASAPTVSVPAPEIAAMETTRQQELPMEQTETAPDLQNVPSVGDETTAAPNAERMTGEVPDLTAQMLPVEAKAFGRSVRLYFPFRDPTPSAVFKKSGVIWAVFDTALGLDVSAARTQLASIADDLEVWRSGRTAVLRIPLKNSRLVTFSPEGYGWLLTIGDMVVEPTKPLHMARTKISGGRDAMRVKFEGVGSILKLRDPGTGENLHVVTGLGPARGFVKSQELVDFSTLISAHGIAVTEKVDDLQVARDGGFVYISSSKGLILSNSGSAKVDLSGLSTSNGQVRETYLNLDELIASTPAIFTRERQALEAKVSQFDDIMAIQSEMALAKLLLANGYATESLGHLQIIEASAPEFARGRGFRTLFAAAELFAGRPDSAFRRLNHPEFDNDADASVWRGLAAARSGRWREAEDALDLASTVAQDYSMQVRNMMLLDGVEIALLDQQFGDASASLAEVNPAYLNQEGVARYNLLRGKIDVARNNSAEALEAFKTARDTNFLPISTDAWLQEIKLKNQENQISNDQAIDELEGLTTIWRGDEVELNALRTLAHLYVDKGEYRNAFETLKAATSSNAASDVTRVLQEEMNGVFSSLFLDGKVDELSAIKALSLYYDFRELTPVGRRGDEMVRRLADKLVEVDLLDRAEELLKHQVDNRLKGAARSQIAADLAVIYLLDRKPNMALDVLRRTRQSQLPLSLERQRRLVEAKALAELNKVDLALELIKQLQGSDVEQLRADILWRSKRWQDVAEQIEQMMGDRWSVPDPLDKEEQTNILRAGIAYTLSDDRLGLDRLRRKYAKMMSDTPVSGAFDVVTLPIEQRNGQEFQAIAQEIAGISTMERFLQEYRTRYLQPNGDAGGNMAEQAPANGGGAVNNPANNPNNPQV
ncbi:hypothetical protein [uncultured Cohaesibacter sp.]|uniref:tetratricopeptide repeat protein n=1 Tax=uncultured Cohaesibacter sp. TaxID=1002546 RepID=UPI0029C6089A|nr:hypothetical protein [uncultured Cohaesibacter sp.]